MNRNPSAEPQRPRPSPARWVSVVALCALCACSDDPPPELPTGLLEPVALDAQLVMVDRNSDRAFVLDVADKMHHSTRVVKLPHGSQSVSLRNGANEALVLGLGRRADKEQKAEPAMLTAVEAGGELRRYELGNPFDRLAQSEDGRYAFLFKSGSSLRLLDNPNEVAIVDLSAEPEDEGAVTLRTLRSFGDSPSNVIFSPVMNIVGEDRRLAVVFSASNVTLVDLTHLDRRETTVQLSSSAGNPVQPQDVAFHPSEPEIYVRANSNDVFVFNLRERRPDEDPSDGEPHNDFRPFIDQLGIGGQPSDMKVYANDGGPRLLVVSGSTRKAATVDADTSQVVSVSLPAPASHALLFEAGSPRDSERATRALLYQPGSNAILFLDLADLETRGGRNLEALSLEHPVARLLPMLDEHQVLVLHDDAGVSLVDLEARTVTLITSVAQLNDARFDAARRTLWFGPPAQPFVGLLDLKTGNTSEILLDANVQRLIPIFGAGQVAIVHDGKDGYLTLIDAERPARETTTIMRGFFE